MFIAFAQQLWPSKLQGLVQTHLGMDESEILEPFVQTSDAFSPLWAAFCVASHWQLGGCPLCKCACGLDRLNLALDQSDALAGHRLFRWRPYSLEGLLDLLETSSWSVVEVCGAGVCLRVKWLLMSCLSLRYSGSLLWNRGEVVSRQCYHKTSLVGSFVWCWEERCLSLLILKIRFLAVSLHWTAAWSLQWHW